MVDVDNAVIARLTKNGRKFEILVDCDKALEFREGKITNLNDVLATKDIFSDVKKGEHASGLKSAFDTEDPVNVAKIILKKGEIQLTTEHKNRLREEVRKRIVNLIHRNSINPQNNLPHPPQRIEAALQEAKVRIDEFKSVEEQAEKIIKQINAIIPIKYETRELAIKIPAKFAGQSFGVVKQFARVLKDDWQDNGSLLLIVEIPAGLQNDLTDRLNNLTKGSIEVSVIKTK